MAKIDLFIFGYRKLKIDPADLSIVTGILLRSSIPSRINTDGTITVRERDFDKITNLLSGRVDFTYSHIKGIYGFWKGLNNRWILVSSLAVSCLILVFSSSLVWDIRVEGNEKITDSEIVVALGEKGFQIGDFWFKLDLDKIEADLLDSNEKISWVNINRRGTVAYIKLLEKEETDKEEPKADRGYTNIIANCDCVIEEITVKSGTSVVSPGDVVKKGDILVIGSLPEEAGGGFCNAEATIKGRISDRIGVEVERNYEKKVRSDTKLHSFTIKFFKFFLNIFKSYRNLTNECAIIEDEITYSLFDRYKLPIKVSRSYIIEEKYESVVYTDEDLVNIASARLNSLMSSRLENGDLIRVKSGGKFTENGYYLYSDILYLSDVGVEVEFSIE